MANPKTFLDLTSKVGRPTTTHVAGDTAISVGKATPGANPFAPKTQHITTAGTSKIGQMSAEAMRALETDWKELTLDFTQLGLTIVGLIEVAEPVQVAADISNGGIDIARGHPVIGAISIASATPLLGLLSGIALSGVRIFKCIWSSFKVLGRMVIVLAAKTLHTCQFVYLRRGILLNFVKQAQRFIVNTGERIIEGFPAFTEKLHVAIENFGKRCATEQAQVVQKHTYTGNMPSLESAIKTNNARKVQSAFPPPSTNQMIYKVNTRINPNHPYGNLF